MTPKPRKGYGLKRKIPPGWDYLQIKDASAGMSILF